MRMLLLAIAVLAACGKVKANAPPCESAAECTDSAAPFCVDGDCVATCASAADCLDPARPVCADDGACVGCETVADCADETAPVCDAVARACRGCARDAECADGVCIEAEGACVGDADVGFVTESGTDNGMCTRAAPCFTLQAANNLPAAPRVLHILGGSFGMTDTLVITRDLVIDGEDSAISGTSQPFIVNGPSGRGILEGIRVVTTDPSIPAILITANARGHIHQVRSTGLGFEAILARADLGTQLVLTDSHLGTLGAEPSKVVCTNATMRADHNQFETAFIEGLGCQLTVAYNRFDSDRDRSVSMNSGLLIMENNLIVHRMAFNDSIAASQLLSGSTIRFNTVVNTTPVDSDGAALSCDGSVDVTSNIFAYRSMHPLTGSCTASFSVFDQAAVNATGPGNELVDPASIFVDRVGGDYHLSADSPARQRAEPELTMVKDDFEGNPRPNPAGSTADSGAFEAP